MSIYTIWIPGEHGYKEHCDRMKVSYDNITAIKEQTDQFKESISRQRTSNSDQIISLIASNDQIISVLDDGLNRLSEINERGFNRLSEINERGFNQVTSAIENLQSDMNYCFGVVIQKLEYQNSLLSGILSVLAEPFETQVKEFYKKGCLFIKQGFLEGAVDCFKESISLKMGEYFFPSYYQLGRIYLTGVEEGINMIDLKSATINLLKATEFGNRIAKTDPSFNFILADCKFFLSQSYYFQLTGEDSESDLVLLNKAIQYCTEATSLNKNLSQGHYHLAKYYSYRIGKYKAYQNENEFKNALAAFRVAVSQDRNYLRSLIADDPFYDKAFEPMKQHLTELIVIMSKEKGEIAENALRRALHKIKQLEELGISDSIRPEFKKNKQKVDIAASDFRSKTYFGYDNCIINLDNV